jgi:asparagine synthase (glutamine-hydrolysing)
LDRGVAMLPSGSGNMTFDFRVKQLLRGLRVHPTLRHQTWIGSFAPEEMHGLLSPELAAVAHRDVVYEEVLADAHRTHGQGVARGSVEEALRFFLTRYLADDILVKADRASMMASLELRAPFLDTDVVEFALKLPWQTKLSLRKTKRVLKRALLGVVPNAILERPKKGFGIPVAQWIRGPLRPMFQELFSTKSLEASGIFRPGPTQALLERHMTGRADLRKPLWTSAMLLLWQRQWGASA